jgi:phosphoribosyl 1,2-cyclic phosphodiesterase
MKITFLGTRGNIKLHSIEHKKHTTTLISHRGTRVLIDWGEDWLSEPFPSDLAGIFISHAHADHVAGLRRGAPCPVFATRATWRVISFYRVHERRIISINRPVRIGHLTLEAFSVEHALNAPAVGYRITDGDATIFYVPDLVRIRRPRAALRGVDCYIGDGAIVERYLLVRSRDGSRIGHSPIAEQLKWCKCARVPRAIFTHCGSEITSSDAQEVALRVAQLGEAQGVAATVACDGDVVRVGEE